MTKPMHKKILMKKVDLSLLGIHVPGSFNILKKKKREREKQKETDHAVTSFYFIILTKSGQCRMLRVLLTLLESKTSVCSATAKLPIMGSYLMSLVILWMVI